MRRITALLFGVALAIISLGPFALAEDMSCGDEGPALINACTHRMFLELLPEHTHTGGSTATLYAGSHITFAATSTQTTTATGTGSAYSSETKTGTATTTTTGTATTSRTGTLTLTANATDTHTDTWTYYVKVSGNTGIVTASATSTVTESFALIGTGTATGTGTGTGIVVGTATASATASATATAIGSGSTTHDLIMPPHTATGTITVTATISGTATASITGTATVTSSATLTASGSGTGTWTNTATTYGTGTSVSVEDNPTIGWDSPSIAAGTTNVRFSTGTSTVTATSGKVGDGVKVHVAEPSLAHVHTLAMPGATKTVAQNGTLTMASTDVGTTTPTISRIPIADAAAKLGSGWIPWTDVSSHLLPRTTGTYSLGSPSLRFTTLDLSAGLYVGSSLWVTNSAITGNLGSYLAKNFEGYAVSVTTSSNSTVTWVDILSQSYTPKNVVGASAGKLSVVATAMLNYTGRCCIRVLIGASAGHAMCSAAGGFMTIPAHHIGAIVDNSAPVTVKLQMISDSGATCESFADRGDIIIFER
jgi:hypothetical protein